jgi:hypothetical protein
MEVRRAGLRKAAGRFLEASFVTPDMLHPEWKMLQSTGSRRPASISISPTRLRMTGNRIKRLTNDENDNMLLAANIGLAIRTNVAVIATLRSQIEIFEKRLQGRVKSDMVS